MTRARGSEEMGEEEVEKEEEKEVEKTSETSGSVGISFEDLVYDWDGPDDLTGDLVDLVWDTVKDWLKDWQSAAGNFFHYCISLCDNLDESYEVRLWMLNLVSHNVAEDESWLDSVHTAKDWGQILLSGDWEVPPPLWLVRREEEEEKTKESKSEKAKESLECVTNSSLLDPGWGKGLPAPTPTVAALSTPVWRPWEEEEDVVVNLSAAVLKRKRRSPAAAARSRQRLRQWQEKMDRNQNRLKSELRNTPQRSVEQMRGTRLLDRLESRQLEVEDHLYGRQQDGGGGGIVVCAGAKGSWVEGKTVFVSNQTQTSMLPQSFKPSMSTFAPVMSSPSTSGACGTRFNVPNVVTLCPTCHAWGLLTRA